MLREGCFIENILYYHGTSLSNAENIIKEQHFLLKNTVGTLGFGAYAFEYSSNNAIKFATNKINNGRMTGKDKSIAIVSFEIDKSQVFDLSDPRNIEFFHNYIESHKNEIDALSLELRNGINGYSKKLDGAIIDTFINEMKHNGINILGVKGPTKNHFGKVKIKDTGIPNSVELCIKSNKIIDYDTIKLEKGDDLI